ncbi:hypothetical protein [Bacillus sp. FJAT-45037]|uniref:hypothetical protein n=1 Tax=Bacillus sp. FJAT-45037 TaxID=2011007 RepID=UPI000C235625|nr:hypothetical protein [Bacillus sp. FJAT-45037]
MANLTSDEQKAIHHYILLLVARQVLERDYAYLEQSQLKLAHPYLELTKLTLDHLSREISSLKSFLRSHQMTIEKKKHDGLFSEYYYRCRGYEGVTHILNAHLKNQVHDYVTSCFTTFRKPS